MKCHTLLYILLLMALSQTGVAQTFRGRPVPYRDQQLSSLFKAYQVYEIPVAELHRYVQAHVFAVPITLIMGNEVFEWTLYENPIIKQETKGTTLQNGEYIPLEFDRACRTFIGFNQAGQSNARFTIRANNFAAIIPDGEDLICIQPLHQINQSGGLDKYVVYRRSDTITFPSGSCGAHKATDAQDPSKDKKESGKQSKTVGQRTFSCLELQVSFATDNQMWQEYEDVELLLDFNLTVLNVLEAFYDDFDLDFWVAEFFMVTDPSNAANPWGDADDVEELQTDFGDWAGAYFSTQDIGHLWSGFDLHDGENYNAIGYASIGGTCGDIGLYQWAVLERFSATDFYNLALLQAHEYGHLLDADHEENTGTIMEPSLNLVESATWAQANIDEMFDFIEDEACIQTCVQCPLSYTIVDYISWGDWKYSAALNVNSSAVIDDAADVIFQSEGFVKLTPGFRASSVLPASGGATFVAKIAGCE